MVLISRLQSRCLKKFLHYFPRGFYDDKYIAWERGYKWNAHLAWTEKLNNKELNALLADHNYPEVGRRATAIESKTNLLFSFEKMALRDGIKDTASAKIFAEGLNDYLYGRKSIEVRFEQFCQMISSLPVKQTRVLTWPIATVFGFIAQPSDHIYLKPTVTKNAAAKFGFDLKYHSQPGWAMYQRLLEFASEIREYTKKLKPRDMIDIQSFIWVLGSEEYPD